MNQETVLKIGKFRVPVIEYMGISLLWNNAKDRDLDSAIKALKTKNNRIEQIVIKTESNKASYATNKIIEWFLNQHWNDGIRYTHNKQGHLIQEQLTTKYRVFIPQLWLWIDDEIYRLTPQMHIFPSMNDEHLTEDIIFPVYSTKGKVHYYEGRSEYAYYKHIQALLENTNKAVEVKPKKEANDFTPALYQALCDAYEIESDHDKAFEQIEYYTMNHIPITRMPRDEVVYEFFVNLGIAPNAQNITEECSIYDDSNLVYIGKETYLETYEEQENDYN